MLFGLFKKRRRTKTVTAKSRSATNKRRYTLESLEDRRMLAGMVLASGGVLQITGSDGINDTAQVSISSSKVTATLNGRSQSFTGVNAITFYGGTGNDTFKNTTSIFASAHGEGGADTLIGGPGRDWLEGGIGNDRLEGGGGDDRYVFDGTGLGTDTIVDTGGVDVIDLSDRGGSNTLDLSKTGVQVVNSPNLSINLQSASSIENVYGSKYSDVIFGNGLANKLQGNGGHDRLYGRGGADQLEGGDGNDAMFGGAGSDTLVGGAGDDRYLVQSGDTTSGYSSGYDAKITFTNGKSSWTDAEIEVVDRAFAQLFDRVGTQSLVRDPAYGPELTFKKDVLQGANGVNSVSSGIRTISINEWNESDSAANLQKISTVIHEIGHNWDTETEGLGVFTEFMKLSGWTQTKPSSGSYTLSGDGKWYHRTSAVFAETYGKHNPREDWSTVFKVYFRDGGYNAASPIAAKLKIVDGLMDWIEAGMPLGIVLT